ncbi:ribosomal RNA large subunit methyltransferase F-like protein, partial [Paraphysoderma sedebokerense]
FPNIRLNYVHWLEDLLQVYEVPNQRIVGLDVGTGASCIYPLLGCRLHPTWKFFATDISSQSISFAKDNITRNNLADKIHLYLNPDSQITLPINEMKTASEDSESSIPESLDFTMCNPPFYSSEQHMVNSQAAKKGDAFATCTGASHEMITAGGEYQFVKKMILESEKYGSQVRWFTSMIGIKETLNKLILELEKINVKSYTTTTFRQGYTLRWALAWSYTEEVPDELKVNIFSYFLFLNPIFAYN